MEALVVGAAILIALVMIDASYWLAVSLIRWAPVLIVATIAGWLAQHRGLAPLEALALSALASVVARHLSRRTDRAHKWYD
ncbi:MAG: hypothetical protein NVV62_15420 [Terricaulis sp.]|nr:hypothetical protein [Terricaulis sp.]